MSDLANRIEDHVNRILSKKKLYSSICKVISVDESSRTCDVEPINGDAERTGRLQASLNLTDGIYIKPTINSFVQLTWINEITGTITQFSEIDEIDITIGGSSLNIIDGQVTFDGGNLGGLVKITKLTEKLNGLVNEINTLKDTFNNHIHTTTATVGATATPGVITPTSTPGVSVSSFTKSDYENEDVKH